MSNVIRNPELLARLWAAVACDFESLLAQFMAGQGWRYIHFAAICRQMEITLVMHITQCRGVARDEHYQRTTEMILILAKNLWLRPMKIAAEEKPSALSNESMTVKRALGGFFLVYTMFKKQPIKGKIKISLNLQDMKAFHSFCKAIKNLSHYKEVAFMLHLLKDENAFHYCIYSETYGMDPSTRDFLDTSQSPVVFYTNKLQDVHYSLIFSPVHAAVEEEYRKLSAMKNSLALDMIKTLMPNNINAHFTKGSIFYNFVRAVNSNSFVKAMTKLDGLMERPVLSMPTLTNYRSFEKQMILETYLRWVRAKRRATRAQRTNGEKNATRPYVRAGGIFGRKKEIEEKGENAPVRRRRRGARDSNLFKFIKGVNFEGTMGDSGPETGNAQGQGEENQGQVENIVPKNEI